MKRAGYTPNKELYSSIFYKDINEEDLDKVLKDYERIYKRKATWDNIFNFTMREYENLGRKELKIQLRKKYPSFDILIKLNQYNNDIELNKVVNKLHIDKNADEYKENDYYYEGKRAFRLHNYIDRNPKLIKDAKDIFIKKHNGQLFCEVCNFNFYKVYGKRGYGFIEAHHTTPISKIKENGTKIEDMAMVCSNCHRMLHREPFLTVDELRKLINS
ncbi:HNH endonuclease [Tepidibacillus sp. HK-1]|uniref:HNH endonuclease n=1 Tax=Tepidibacillus sp. HK-1 TaxID=1883407 RepID=UPI0008590DD2|nr:HNH endonuclease [Tepidibacillus sp. HK-1]GBF12644.1 HNH endonuclease [Tepidibacillus sp. HK-1]